MKTGFDSRYWNGLMPDGYDYKFVGIKLSGGTSFVPKEPKVQWVRSVDHNLARLPFHYWRGSRLQDPTEHGIAQAEHFYKTMRTYFGGDPGELPPAIDCEDKHSRKGLATVTDIKACLIRTEELWGRRPMIYTAGHFWDSWCMPYADYWSDWSPYDYDLWEADPPPDTSCGKWDESVIIQVLLDWSAPGFNAGIDVNKMQQWFWDKHISDNNDPNGGGIPDEKEYSVKATLPIGTKVEVEYV